MKVPFSSLERQFKFAASWENPKNLLGDLLLNDLKELVQTGDFTLGKKLKEFEKTFSNFIGVKHAIGVGSGTDSLFLSLKALNVGPGDEVITAAETFIATAGSIVAVGAKPVFVDVNDEFVIEATNIEKAITPKTKAVIPVYFTGNCPDMMTILSIAKRYNLVVVEDSCCALDATINGKKAGSFGNTGTFSFHPLKNLNAWGDGGMITTNSDEVARQLTLLRNHGLTNRDEADIFGFNSRLDTIQAAIALRLIDFVEETTNKRIANAQRLDQAFSKLEDFVDVPKRSPIIRHSFHLYMVRAKDRDKLLRHCIEKGIEAKIHYPIPLHYQKCCQYLGYKKGDFPKTERDCATIITFPCHEYLTDEEIDYMIGTVTKFYRR